MSGCSGNCSSCGESCSDRKPESLLAEPNKKSNVKKVIAVVSGKGGVGKSTVTSMLAVAMQKLGYKTAILDADVTGPSIPRAFGLHEQIVGSDDGMLPAETPEGIKVMSINLLLPNETDPVIWRGRSSAAQSSSSGRMSAGAMWIICSSICRPERAT